ncbi:MAG: FAD-dependent oxidoreductase, partial [Betaproteobacteria bacterium]|nr:FAD-dependent oxidoreductase [Betaproteobacteria bacterium]
MADAHTAAVAEGASPRTDPDSTEPVDYDVIVIGAGGAGLAAACAAAEQGARVLVLEKLPALLGTTSYSVGSFAAAGTRMQSAAGIADRAADFAQDMALATPQTPDTVALRDMLARESGPTLDWLERLGVVFVGPYPEPPNRVPRMHNAVPAGHRYLAVLAAQARRLGVEIRFGTSVSDLLIVQSRVAGVRTKRDQNNSTSPGSSEPMSVTAHAVVLAAGDYSASKAWRSAHLSPNAASAIPINPNSTGDGHRLALQAGAALKRLDGVFGPQLR